MQYGGIVMSDATDNITSGKKTGKKPAPSFELMLNGKPCGCPLPREALEALSGRLGETMCFYYSRHPDEYRSLCDAGIMRPTSDGH